MRVDSLEDTLDVIADESAVLLRSTFRETRYQSIDHGVALALAGDGNFPQRQKCVSCGDEAFVFGKSKQRFCVFEDARLRIAFGEIAQHLAGDGTLSIV